MPLAKCLALHAGPKQHREGWSNYVECPLLSAFLYVRCPTQLFLQNHVPYHVLKVL